MHRSRRSLVVLLVALLAATAGCVGFLAGSEPLAFAASGASVGDAQLSSTGYTLVTTDSRTLSEEFTVAGQTRTVEVTNELAQYSRELDLGPAGEQEVARFALLATPQVEIAGRTFNPVGSMSNQELVARLQGEYGSIQDIEPAGERGIRVLGESRTISTFTATAQPEAGPAISVRIHVASINHGSDFVIAVAVHPSRIDETERVDELLRGIQHSG